MRYKLAGMMLPPLTGAGVVEGSRAGSVKCNNWALWSARHRKSVQRLPQPDAHVGKGKTLWTAPADPNLQCLSLTAVAAFTLP